MREQWPQLRWMDFDPGSDMARAFAACPPRLGVDRYHKGRTPLGWVCFQMSCTGPSQQACKWVEFLLGCGANPELPLCRQPRARDYLAGHTLRKLAFAYWRPAFLRTADREDLVAILERAGVDPLGPVARWRFESGALSLAEVANARRLDLMEAFAATHLDPLEKDQALARVVASWRANPDLAAAAVPRLEKLGLAWRPEDAPLLWDMALGAPDGPWIGWAVDHWRRHGPDTLPRRQWEREHWRREVGRMLVINPHPGHDKVRAALESLVAPSDRRHWAPVLPDLGLDASSPALSRRQWSGVLRLVQWACHWGLPPSARTPCGFPWALWILVQAHRSCQRSLDGSETAGCQALAWESMDALVRSGTRLGLRPAHASSLGVWSGKSVNSLMEATFNGLDLSLGPWRQRLGRLRRAVALDRAIQRRLDRDGYAPPPPPRPAPRL